MQRRTFLAGAAGTAVAVGTMGEAGAVTTLRQHQQGGGTTHTVGMYTEGSDYYFDPVGLYVEPGDTVEWTIESGQHSTASYSQGNPQASNTLIPEGAKSWDSGVISSGSFSYTFQTEGTYDYYCTPHKSLGMVARIVCGSPGGPAEGTEIPDEVGSGIVPESDTIMEDKSLEYPYVPGVSHGGPPALFWGGTGVFAATTLYLYSVYDRATGRYDDNEAGEGEY
ncbi:plastocyanin/azurin family copper-binding protein [Halococcus salsus]|uniref:plastocyanin/azurin family copper-binding protein n=1 Tax=Halococcus salsus TaxID=2162894 RepID=UPI00135A638B|nr:plastocyanin/azurin family copper-binding protein [Halococcus salsus]